ncbi:hypothetical protein M885DRAFT_536762 [Pelagophyceae sp. CCMP2097]|nr:hypothetical protein M885DRAFT_536762 [Pelagophyceae sp. CCMP2097]
MVWDVATQRYYKASKADVAADRMRKRSKPKTPPKEPKKDGLQHLLITTALRGTQRADRSAVREGLFRSRAACAETGESQLRNVRCAASAADQLCVAALGTVCVLRRRPEEGRRDDGSGAPGPAWTAAAAFRGPLDDVGCVAWRGDGALGVASLGGGTAAGAVVVYDVGASHAGERASVRRVSAYEPRFGAHSAVWCFDFCRDAVAVGGHTVGVGKREGGFLANIDSTTAQTNWTSTLSSDCLRLRCFNDKMLYGCRDGSLGLADGRVRGGAAVLLRKFPAAVDEIAVVDAYRFVAADRGGALELVDVRRPLAAVAFRGHVGGGANAGGFHVDGDWCVAGGGDAKVRCWRLCDGKLFAEVGAGRAGTLLAPRATQAHHPDTLPRFDFIHRATGAVVTLGCNR